MNLSGESNTLSHVRHAADPGDGPLDAESEAGVDEGSVFPQIEIPAVPFRIESLFLDPGEQAVVVVFAL